MARQSTKPSWEALQAELADPDYKVRKEAIKQLMRHYRKQAYEPLLAMLEDKRGEVRARAVQALGKLKERRALIPVLGLLADKHTRVRTQVIWAVGELGDRSMVRTLIALLNDSNSQICASAARSLGKLGDPSSLPALCAYLERARKEGDTTQLYDAARAVDDFGAIEPLLTLCERTSTTRVHMIVIEALSRQVAHTRPLLEEITVDQTRSNAVRACVAQVLALKPHPDSLQPLLTALTDDYCVVREHAAEALANVQDPRAIEPLTRLLDDQDGIVCAAAVRALGALHATTAVEPLIALLSFDSPSDIEVHLIVRATIETLGKLGDTRAVKPLLAMLFQRESSYYAAEIARAPRTLNDPAIVEPLLQHLPVSQGTRRWQIVSLLEHFRDPRSVEPLLALLDVRATDRWERRFQVRVVEALGVLGDPRAIEPLRAALYQTTDEVHAAIWSTLRTLGRESKTDSLL